VQLLRKIDAEISNIDEEILMKILDFTASRATLRYLLFPLLTSAKLKPKNLFEEFTRVYRDVEIRTESTWKPLYESSPISKFDDVMGDGVVGSVALPVVYTGTARLCDALSEIMCSIIMPGNTDYNTIKEYAEEKLGVGNVSLGVFIALMDQLLHVYISVPRAGVYFCRLIEESHDEFEGTTPKTLSWSLARFKEWLNALKRPSYLNDDPFWVSLKFATNVAKPYPLYYRDKSSLPIPVVREKDATEGAADGVVDDTRDTRVHQWHDDSSFITTTTIPQQNMAFGGHFGIQVAQDNCREVEEFLSFLGPGGDDDDPFYSEVSEVRSPETERHEGLISKKWLESVEDHKNEGEMDDMPQTEQYHQVILDVIEATKTMSRDETVIFLVDKIQEANLDPIVEFNDSVMAEDGSIFLREYLDILQNGNQAWKEIKDRCVVPLSERKMIKTLLPAFAKIPKFGWSMECRP